MYQSIQKNKKGILLMVISSLLACVGQLLWKISIEQGLMVLFLGFVCYGLGAMVMIYAYRFGELSVLQPVLSLNYVVSFILGVYILNEKITLTKCIGVTIIIFGVILITGGDRE